MFGACNWFCHLCEDWQSQLALLDYIDSWNVEFCKSFCFRTLDIVEAKVHRVHAHAAGEATAVDCVKLTDAFLLANWFESFFEIITDHF